eukprot:1150302-Pelagomonas_calceolata.AAC.1
MLRLHSHTQPPVEWALWHTAFQGLQGVRRQGLQPGTLTGQLVLWHAVPAQQQERVQLREEGYSPGEGRVQLMGREISTKGGTSSAEERVTLAGGDFQLDAGRTLERGAEETAQQACRWAD